MAEQMYGVFGPGDGKPVAVFPDHDEAAREGRKRFGDRANVFPVDIGGLSNDQRAAVEDAKARALAEALAGPPLRSNATDVLRSQVRAQLLDEGYREALREELKGEAGELLQGNLREVRERDEAEAAEREERERVAAESRQRSHAALTELQTGEAPPEGEEPRSAIHEFGLAPAAAGDMRGEAPHEQPINDPGVTSGTETSGANPAAMTSTMAGQTAASQEDAQANRIEQANREQAKAEPKAAPKQGGQRNQRRGGRK